MGVSGSAINIRTLSDLRDIDAVIIPGGESTTISKILVKSGMYSHLKTRIDENDIAIMGTCAGCVLLAEELSNPPALSDVHLLNAMSMKVERNAFGRQRESFEHPVNIIGLNESFNAVFIRATIIRTYRNGCKPIGFFEKQVIAAQQGRFLALSFHPELTDDIRLHRFFLEML